MVTVAVNEKNTIPTVTTHSTQNLSASGTTSGQVAFSGQTPFDILDGETIYSTFASYNNSGFPTYVYLRDLTNSTNRISSFSASTSWAYRAVSWKNTTGSTVSVQFEYSGGGSGSFQYAKYGHVILDQDDIDSFSQGIANYYVSSANSPDSVNWSRKLYLNKWYVFPLYYYSNLTIDGTQFTFSGGLQSKTVDTIITASEFTYNSTNTNVNNVGLSYTGGNFQVSA